MPHCNNQSVQFSTQNNQAGKKKKRKEKKEKKRDQYTGKKKKEEANRNCPQGSTDTGLTRQRPSTNSFKYAGIAKGNHEQRTKRNEDSNVSPNREY